MSLNYFLLCKKLTEDNLLYFDGLIVNYNKMYTELLKQYECMSDCDEIQHYRNILRLRQDCIDKKKEQEELLELYKDRIYKLCNHNFENDEIDITPERSQTITYCTICESNKK
jgi:hypothetical protein